MRDGTSLLVALACLFLYSTIESSLAIPAEQILAEVNKLPPPERQKTLEEGARKEGVIKFASNESVEGIKILHGAFAARYPFIKVESWRAPELRKGAGLQSRSSRLLSGRAHSRRPCLLSLLRGRAGIERAPFLPSQHLRRLN